MATYMENLSIIETILREETRCKRLVMHLLRASPDLRVPFPSLRAIHIGGKLSKRACARVQDGLIT